MRTLWSVIGLGIALLCASSHAHGQKATEQYIPIGQSPGVSQKLTYIGPIQNVDPRGRTITVVEPSGPRTVKITERTRIWLDRTKLKSTNLKGSFEDLRKGRRVEVRYADPAQRRIADWVKVEIGAP